MSRILFEPKRRMLVRTMFGFAVVLAIQAGFSGYFVFSATDRLLQTSLDDKLMRMAELAAAHPLVGKVLTLHPNDKEWEQTTTVLSNYLTELVHLVDVRRAYLVRVIRADSPRKERRFDYMAGSLRNSKRENLPTMHVTNTELEELAQGKTITSSPFVENGKLLKPLFVPILEEKDLKGFIVVDADAKDLVLLDNLKTQLWVIAAVAFMIAVVISFMLARTIVRSTTRLVAAAEQLGLGDFNVRYEVTGIDEISFLGQTFNDMAEDIQRRDEQIRRMNEAALADALQLYEHVLRAAYAGIITVDNEGKITSENPAAVQVLGPNQGSSNTMRERLKPYPPLLELWEQGETVRDREVELFRHSEQVVVEATILPLTDHRNEPIGHTLMLVDRTEIKKLEAELSMRDRLAALGELAAGIAHEIRNPLNGIQLMLGLVQEDLSDKGVVDDRFVRIYDEVSRLNTILNDFLMFARPKPLEKSTCNLFELVEDAVMLVAPYIEEKKIEVVRDYDAELPDTPLDAAAMRRVFVNLIKNACEAMDNNHRLYLTIKGPASTQNGFQITVRDTGPGIPPEVRDRLFNPFVTTKDNGTGLGLSIVHKTVINHQGSISCHNHADGGACFHIVLPHTGVH